MKEFLIRLFLFISISFNVCHKGDERDNCIPVTRLHRDSRCTIIIIYSFKLHVNQIARVRVLHINSLIIS
jgi:hypothetical protein